MHSRIEDEIAFQGAGTIAAFIMEPILGAGGVIPPHESFMLQYGTSVTNMKFY